MDIGTPELLIILVLVILLFGVGRIGKIAGEMGSGIRAFREGLRGEELDVKEPKQSDVEVNKAVEDETVAPVTTDHKE